MKESDNAADGIVNENENAASFSEQEFANWCEANEIDYDENDMDEESLKDFLRIKKRFVKTVKVKRLVVDGTMLIYTVSKFSKAAGTQLTISRPDGGNIIAMDGNKGAGQLQKFQGYLASIAKTEKSFIARLDISDYQFLADIGALFLVS